MNGDSKSWVFQGRDLLYCVEYLSSINRGKLLHRNLHGILSVHESISIQDLSWNQYKMDAGSSYPAHFCKYNFQNIITAVFFKVNSIQPSERLCSAPMPCFPIFWFIFPYQNWSCVYLQEYTVRVCKHQTMSVARNLPRVPVSFLH